MNKLFAILPCYNEELNIGELIDKWHAQTEKLLENGYELNIVGIDDCSKDNTKKVIEEKCGEYDNVFLLPHTVNKGLCGGLNSAVHYFLEHGSEGDLMTLMDGDNTHDPKYVHDMLRKLTEGNKDCVIASRYCKDSAVVGVASHREFMSDMAKFYYSFMLRVPNVKDYTCGYRIYTYSIIRKLVDKYGDTPVIEKSFACMMELLYKLYTVGATFDETGFELRYDNKQGQSKMNVLKTMTKSLTTAVKLRADSKRAARLNYKISPFMIYGFFCFFALVLLSATHFFVTSDNFGHDSGIFAYVGFAITKGKALYLEAWDNKGPLLYLINALGIVINYRYGICILEFITLLSSLCLLYKTANLFISKEASAACAMVCMMTLTTIYEGGNLAEEYALPFTILGFYLIAKFFKNDSSLSRFEMVITGMCISAVFLIRLNILAYLGCAVLGVVIFLIKKKEYKKLGMVTLYAFAGFVIFLIPFIIYLASTGTLKACIDTAYLQILGQFSDITIFQRINNMNLMTLEITGNGTFFIIVCFLFFYLLRLVTKRKDDEVFDYLCKIAVFGLITTFLANGASGSGHRHYFISFIPVLIIPTVALAKYIMQLIERNCDEKYHNDDFKAAAIFVLAFAISAPSLFSYVYNTVTKINPDVISYQRTVNKYIVENTDETDLIQVFGNDSAVSSYYGSGRLAASNYFYYANGRFSDEAKSKFAVKIYADVIKTQPKLIMFENTGNPGKMEDFIDHIPDKNAWYAFLNDNYDVTDNYIDYTVYKHK